MIDQSTRDKLDALALTIFDTTGQHLTQPSTEIDNQLAALIKEPMKVIDGRDLALGFKYTLNVTNALQLRPKKWYLNLGELDTTSFWPCICNFEYRPQPGYVQGGVNSFGYTLGLATCAAICHAWSNIIARWMMGEYPSAVTKY